MVSSEPQKILLPNLVWWWCRMSQSVTQNENCLLSSWSRSQRELILSKYYSDYDIFWTADSLATKLGPIIGYHRSEPLVENWITAFTVQVTAKGQNVGDFVQIIYSEPQNILLPNLVWWCSIKSQSVTQKMFACCLQGQGDNESLYDQNMTDSATVFEQQILSLPNLVW